MLEIETDVVRSDQKEASQVREGVNDGRVMHADDGGLQRTDPSRRDTPSSARADQHHDTSHDAHAS